MTVKLNGEKIVTNGSLKLSEFIQQQLKEREPNGLAVAVNSKIIPKQQWESSEINPGDEIEIVHAVQGG